jgi:hypothetical protein
MSDIKVVPASDGKPDYTNARVFIEAVAVVSGGALEIRESDGYKALRETFYGPGYWATATVTRPPE